MAHNAQTSIIQGDLFGGVTLRVIALPMALRFGVESGLGRFRSVGGVCGFFAACSEALHLESPKPTGPDRGDDAVIAGLTAANPRTAMAWPSRL